VQAEKEVGVLAVELSKLQDWATKFECEELILPAATSLTEMRELLVMLRQVWDLAQRTDSQIGVGLVPCDGDRGGMANI
jgi:hypothetical protein